MYPVKGCVFHHQVSKAGYDVLKKPENIPSDEQGDFRILSRYDILA